MSTLRGSASPETLLFFMDTLVFIFVTEASFSKLIVGKIPKYEQTFRTN